MEKALLKTIYGEVCASFGVSCDGCPFWQLREKQGEINCEKLLDYYPKDVEITLARFIAGDVALNKLAGPQAKIPETRREILQAAERCVCGGRELDHGTPEQSFHAIALHFTAFLEAKGLLREGAKIDAADAAAMLALFKVARVAAGNFVADSYVDACGYLACSGELAAEREKSQE